VSTHDDLTFETLDIHATEGPMAAKVAAYGDAWHRGFHEGSLSDKQREWWLEHSRADDVTLRAAYPTTSLVADPPPVGTFTSWAGEVNVGGGTLLPLHMITDVTVAPTHRRRGILSRLMTEDLTDAAARGLPLAALTVSEGGIYGRFGFGVATRQRVAEVDTGHGRFRLRDGADDGSLELLDLPQARPLVEQVFAQHLATTRGAVARPAFYTQIEEGQDWDNGGKDTKTRVVVHLDASGSVDGYARFQHKDEGEAPVRGVVELRGMHALTDRAWRRLWAFLADVDLAQTVKTRLPVDTPLHLAVTDPRVVRTSGLVDFLWVRVLDVVAALEARPWREDATVVLEVRDPMGLTDGRFRVTTEEGRASVEPTQEDAGVLLDAETLGALYLGDQPVGVHAAASRLRGPAVDTFAAMADHAGPTPWCSTGF
jgi:predicted acetyltransferase